MGFGNKKFWASVGLTLLPLVPGGGAAVVAGKTIGKLVLGRLLVEGSTEDSHFKAWVDYARKLDANPNIENDKRWTALENRVRSDLVKYYGKEPKDHDVKFNAAGALKDARGDFT